MSFESILDMGSTSGNAIFLGSVYAGVSSKAAVLVSTSYIPDSTITLTVTGTSSPLTVIDAFGNSSSVSISSGRAIIPVSDVPTYVRLPPGVSVTVYEVNDWGQNPGESVSSIADLNTLDGVDAPAIADGAWMTDYATGAGIAYSFQHGMPGEAVLTWGTRQTINRVIVWCGPAWQTASALVDFDVETSYDGVTWVVRKTVTKTGVSSFAHATSSVNAGCTRETYWDEQWVFDVPLGATYEVAGVRISARSTSFGGEPDAEAVAAGGQGHADQHFAIQEIGVVHTDVSVGGTAGSGSSGSQEHPLVASLRRRGGRGRNHLKSRRTSGRL